METEVTNFQEDDDIDGDLSFVRTSSWNIMGGLSDGSVNDDIIDTLQKSSPDFVWLPEAAASDEKNPQLDDRIKQRLEETWDVVSPVYNYGYNPDTQSESVGNGLSTQYGLILSKIALQDVEKILLADERYAIKASIGKAAIYCVHLDDKSEEMRQRMTADLLKDIGDNPAVVMGDFNATYGDDFLAPAFRMVGKRLPAELDQNNFVINSLQRINGMVDGGTMQMFEEAGFSDTNINHAPTETCKIRDHNILKRWPGWLKILQLDHIIVNDIEAGDFKIHPESYSDHKRISTTLVIPHE